MARVVGDVAIEVGADVSPLVRELGKGEGALNRFGMGSDKMGRMVAGAAAGAAAAVAALGAAVVVQTRAAMQNIDALAKQARALGLTTAQFQAMSMVASEAGVEVGKLSSSLGIMQRNIVEATQGSRAQAEAFRRLGIEAESLLGLDPSQQFERLAAAIAGIEDPAQRTAAAMEVFGRGGRDVLNMLPGYTAAIQEATEFQKRFGIAVSEIDAKNIETANDAVERMKSALGGTANVLAASFAPAVAAAANSITEFIGKVIGVDPKVRDARDRIAAFNAAMEKVPGFAGSASDAVGQLGDKAEQVGRKFGSAAEMIREFNRASLEAAGLPPNVAANIADGTGVTTTLPRSPAGMDGSDIESFLGVTGYVSSGRGSIIPSPEDAIEAAVAIYRDRQAAIEEVLEDSGRRQVRIAQETQDSLRNVEEIAMAARLQMVSGALGDLSTLMVTNNKKLFAIGKAAAIAEATVSGYQAAVDAWQKGMKVGGPPVAAAFAGASLARTGALIASIASQQIGGGSGGAAAARGGGAAVSTGGGAAAAGPGTYFNVTLTGGDNFGRAQVMDLIGAINRAVEDGAVIRGIRAA
jgi:hypothetical protein